MLQISRTNAIIHPRTVIYDNGQFANAQTKKSEKDPTRMQSKPIFRTFVVSISTWLGKEDRKLHTQRNATQRKVAQRNNMQQYATICNATTYGPF